MMFDKSKVKNVEIEEVARTGTLRVKKRMFLNIFVNILIKNANFDRNITKISK